MDYVLIFFALSLISLSQILQKLAVINARRYTDQMHWLGKLARCREIWWAMICLIIGTLVWLAVLYRMEVSQAYPFLSLGLVVVMLASRYYFQEPVSPVRWAGVLLIMLGITLLSWL